MIGRPETHPVKKVIGFSEEMIDAVETWRAKQKPVPNLSEAIRAATEAFGKGEGGSRALVLFTDGEDLDPHKTSDVQAAAEEFGRRFSGAHAEFTGKLRTLGEGL